MNENHPNFAKGGKSGMLLAKFDLKSAVMEKFGAVITNVLSVQFSEQYYVFLKSESIIPSETSKIIEEFIKDSLNKNGIDKQPIILFEKIGNQKKPIVATTLLNYLRIFAPCSSEVLVQKFRKNDYYFESEAWLEQKLKELEQGQFIMKQRNGDYALTARAIDLLSTRMDGVSPDVKRTLVINKK